MANKNLTAAKAAKNDEFYTRLEDINEELQHYREHFADKIVYLNCDDGEWSNFWRFFYANFGFFKLKRLIATSYHKDGGSYKYEYEGGYDQSDYVANNYMEGVVKTMLTGDGDFRSDECIEILKQADIVVTNPPFSLFREYIAQLMEYEKKFLIIGNKNAVTLKEVFPLIKNNKLWLGFSIPSGFNQPVGAEPKSLAGLTKWFTNLDHNKRHHSEEYYEQYSEEKYPKYDNYDGIEVSKTSNLPCDWFGTMGVPITWLDKYCPDQFEILGVTKPSIDTEHVILRYDRQLQHDKDGAIKSVTKANDGACIKLDSIPLDQTWYEVDNKILIQTYNRILIRWKPEAMPTINDGVILYK